MSRSLEHLRRRFLQVKQGRARLAAAQARFKRALSAVGFDADRAERAQRKLEEARRELNVAFDDGMSILNKELLQTVRQYVDEPAALQKVLEMALAQGAKQQRRQQERDRKGKPM